MRMSIIKEGRNIMVVKDFTKPRDTGEITQFITELEIAKLELLKIFEEDGAEDED